MGPLYKPWKRKRVVPSILVYRKGDAHEQEQIIGVIFRAKSTIMTELCERKSFVKDKNRNENENKNKVEQERE